METKSTTAFSAAIPVPELLDKHNYPEWVIRVRTYLKGQDLWKVIIDKDENAPAYENDVDDDGVDNDDDDAAINVRRRRNYMALHVILISCGPDAFAEIRSIRSAKTAWQTLEKKYLIVLDTGNIDENYLQYKELYKVVRCGDLTAAKEFIVSQPEAVRKAITDKGETALHIAVTAGHAHIVEELVDLMSKEDLGIEDGDGYTALMTALVYGRSKLVRLLYAHTWDDLLPTVEEVVAAENDGCKGAMFLTRAIYSRNFDLALSLIRRHPSLTHALDDRGESPLLALASMQNAFPSGNRLIFWKQWIYSCIRINELASTIDETDTEISNVGSVPALLLRHLFSILCNLLGIKQLYEMKKLHIQSQKLLDCMCEEISTSFKQSGQLRSISGVYDAITCAVKNGISEFVFKVVGTHPCFLENKYRNSRSILMLAVIYRQSEIFSDIYHEFDMGDTLTSYRDCNDDNMLHMVGMIEDSTKLNQITGAALQMQRELQWFKEVEKILNPKIKEYTNKDGLTPRELFTKNHENMMEKGEKWVKDTASSGTVVGALVVTIMFVVAFSVPGGNDQNTGLPVFLEKKEFMSFLIVDILSLFSASISVLIFLEILTSRHAEEDFLVSLPKKIFIGIFTLFFSFVTMIMSFSAALSIMLRDQNLWIVIFIKCLPVVPVTFFLLIQYPILIEMIRSTFLLPRIFNRKM